MESDKATEAVAKPGKSTRTRRWRRWLGGTAIGGLVALVLVWWAVHTFDWAGPLVANTLRSIVGVDNVAKLEDLVYAVEDRVNRTFRGTEAPKARWSVPQPQAQPAPTPVPAAAPRASSAQAPELPPFKPKDPGPALKSWSAPGDGVWVPIVDPRRPSEPPYLMKTLLHPDVTRGWAEVFVVAVDLRRVKVFMMAGSQEPKADRKEAEGYPRTGRIPEKHHDELLGAFNGGFMTEHGGYGMKLDGTTIVMPKPNACTLALYEDGSMRIATWKKLADSEPQMRWYRQAPECMFEDGKIHPGLTAGSGLKWGATLDGETVIRRSAVGLNAERDILFVTITNHTTARVLADGLRHAGAVDIAQLDVNWSYPKFVLFEPGGAGAPPNNGTGEAGPERKAVALADGFEFSEDEYIRQKARRDFFYLMRRDKLSEQER
ncbi:MAG TPA: hypothetical protein VM686_16485 [Polyangiaceae bacterium]|nr:hypothetical protein [Polyangiaceae bacterium]